MDNIELDGIPLSDSEINLIRIERRRIERIKEREELQKVCPHSNKRYLGYGHTDETSECVVCEKVFYE